MGTVVLTTFGPLRGQSNARLDTTKAVAPVPRTNSHDTNFFFEIIISYPFSRSRTNGGSDDSRPKVTAVRDRWRSLFSMLLAMRLRSIQWRVHPNSSLTTANVPRLCCASLSRALQIFNVRPELYRPVST